MSPDHAVHEEPERIGGMTLEQQQAVAGGLFNRVWALLDNRERTAEEDRELVHAAHASRWHWGHAGGPDEWAIGEWQCSRVYAVLGRGEPAVFHAKACIEIVETNRLSGFVYASAWEALARAQAVAGDLDAAVTARAMALRAMGTLSDPEEREVVAADIATLPPMGDH